MPTRKQLRQIRETEMEFPETRREDDPMYVNPNKGRHFSNHSTMISQETKDRLSQESNDKAEEYAKNEYTDYFKGYIAGAEAEAERAQGLANTLETLNKELDYYWNSSRAMESRKKMPESIRRALCNAQKECAEALTKYNNSK